MKNKSVVFTLLFLIAFSLPLVAQKAMNVEVEETAGPGHKIRIKKMIGDNLKLTPEQKKQFQELKLKHAKEILPLQNDLRVKKLDLKIEMSHAENPNMNKINALVDDIAKIQAEIQKKNIAHKFKLRSLLTDEQKEKWDARKNFKGKHMMREMQIQGPHKFMWFGDDDTPEPPPPPMPPRKGKF